MIREYMLNLGYLDEDIDKMLKNKGVKNLSEETLYNDIKRNYAHLVKLGYPKKNILKMTKSLPILFSLSIKNINTKINNLIELGYSEEEVLKMTSDYPSIYSFGIENLIKKIDDLESFGYTRKEVLKMILELPALFGYGTENITKKIELLREINLGFVILDDPKQLMQSVDLTYARHMFFKEHEIEINKDNYVKIFANAKQFEKQYKISKQELLEKYSYKEYMENKEINKYNKKVLEV